MSNSAARIEHPICPQRRSIMSAGDLAQRARRDKEKRHWQDAEKAESSPIRI